MLAAGADVYDITGTGDSSERVGRAIDGNPSSFWRTDTYNQQFPAFKQGIGVMVSFESAVQLSDLTIDSPSAGTVVEIRSAAAVDAPFADTKVMATSTLQDGSTDIALPGSQPVTHVLVWITKLATPNGQNVSQIDEIRFRRAAG